MAHSVPVRGAGAESQWYKFRSNSGSCLIDTHR